MRLLPRTALRSLTGAAILGFGALALSAAPAAAHGDWGWRHRHPGWHGHHGWHHRPHWRPYYRPHVYYAPRPHYYAPPRVVYAPPPVYYAPRPRVGYYAAW